MNGRQLYFNHQTTKIATTVFGSLFSNIYVGKDQELVAVPINYAGVPKHLVAKTNDDERNMIDRQLPAMSFNISSFNYDSIKKLSSDPVVICCEQPDGSNASSVGSAAPWTIGFQLRIKSKTLDETFQIIEQIIPYFTPKISVNIKDFEELFGDCKYSRSDITLVGFDIANEYEGSFEDKRELESVMDFNMTIPYWGFINGIPGISPNESTELNSGAGKFIKNPAIDISAINDPCGGNLISNQIENVFVNYINEEYKGQASPGIPDDPSKQDFLPEAGAPNHLSTTRIDERGTKFRDYPSDINENPVYSNDYIYPRQILSDQNMGLSFYKETKTIKIKNFPQNGNLKLKSQSENLGLNDSFQSNEEIIFVPDLNVDSLLFSDFFGTQAGNSASINDWGLFESDFKTNLSSTNLDVSFFISDSGKFAVKNFVFPVKGGSGIYDENSNGNSDELYTFELTNGNANKVSLKLSGLSVLYKESFLGANDARIKLKAVTYDSQENKLQEKLVSLEKFIEFNNGIYEIEFETSFEKIQFSFEPENNMVKSNFVLSNIIFSNVLNDNFKFVINNDNEYSVKFIIDSSENKNLYFDTLNAISGHDNTLSYYELTSNIQDSDELILSNIRSFDPVEIYDYGTGNYSLFFEKAYKGKIEILYDVYDGFNTITAKLILNIG